MLTVFDDASLHEYADMQRTAGGGLQCERGTVNYSWLRKLPLGAA